MGRSFSALMVDFYFRQHSAWRRSKPHNTKSFDRMLARNTKQTLAFTKEKVQKYVKSEVKLTEFEGRKVFAFGDQSSQTTLIYFIGSAYVESPTKYHFKMLNKMAEQYGYKIVVPIYHTIQESDYEQEYPVLRKIYEYYSSYASKVIVGGDSSGGGLAMGLSYYLQDNNIRKPDLLLLISPWVDVNVVNNNKYVPELKHDHMVYPERMDKVAMMWAKGEENYQNKLVSPIYGPLETLPPIIIAYGTYEFLYRSIKDLEDKLKMSRVPLVVHCYPKMGHSFPVYPIKEANRVLSEIKEDIKKLLVV